MLDMLSKLLLSISAACFVNLLSEAFKCCTSRLALRRARSRDNRDEKPKDPRV